MTIENSTMRRFLFIAILLSSFIPIYAQVYSVRSIKPVPSDTRARTTPRLDAKGKECAIIRLRVVGLDDLTFSNNVGDVQFFLNEYLIYVPEGIREMEYKGKGGNINGKIRIPSDMNIESKCVYTITMDSENKQRSAIFSINPCPKDANFFFDGEFIKLDDSGIVKVDKPIGKYEYSINAEGFNRQSGVIELTEDEILTFQEIDLEEQVFPITISEAPSVADVFIDNVPYQRARNLKLPKGKHYLRLRAPYYKDYTKEFKVDEYNSPIIVKMKEEKSEIIKHKEDRTRTKVNIRGAHYITLMGDAMRTDTEYGLNLYGGKIEYSSVQHFLAMFGLRIGLGLNLYFPIYDEEFPQKDEIKNKINYLALDIPLQLGIYFPFGKYNRHMFSVYAGGYAKYYTISQGDDIAEKAKRSMQDYDAKEFEKSFLDYGLRASFQLDFHKFTLQGNVDKSLDHFGFGGSVGLGWKIY